MDILNEEKIVQGLEKDLKNLKPGDESARIELNKRLIERYPFLECRGWNTSKPRDYYFTWLDHMHEGWKKTFGVRLCEELREELIKNDFELWESYRLNQVKEKYGTLRWYDNGCTEQMEDIVFKYEKISKYTCICCGKINVPVFEYGWINPYCTDCFRQEFRKNGKKAIASKIDSYIIETPRLTRNMIVKIYSSNGMKRRKIDFSDTLRKLGVNPDELPTIEDIADSGNE